MNERRFESRFLCADLAKVEWFSEEGENKTLRTVEAVLEDISSLGACVQVDERIPSGAAILIFVGDESGAPKEVARLCGQVSYCVFRDYGYFVGIRFANETRWSSGVYEPQHLTSLEALMAAQRIH
jgi:hypothetical protein